MTPEQQTAVCPAHSGMEARLVNVEKLAEKQDKRWDWILGSLIANLAALVLILTRG